MGGSTDLPIFNYSGATLVSGFNVDGINVSNGTAGNSVGGGAVYTFDVTLNAIGEVTVDIAAGGGDGCRGRRQHDGSDVVVGHSV